MNAILLAGGLSSRMGRDKGELFGTQIYTKLASVFSNVIVVTNQPERFPIPSAHCVRDRVPGQGPVEGLRSGLAAMAGDRALLIACDMPFVSIRLLRFLALQPDVADVIVPETEEMDVFLGIYRKSLLPRIDAYLEQGRRSLKGFVENCDRWEIPASYWREYDPEGRSFVNLNTPSDLTG